MAASNKPICRACGSDNVVVGGRLEWDAAEARYEVRDVGCDWHCCDCQSDAGVAWSSCAAGDADTEDLDEG